MTEPIPIRKELPWPDVFKLAVEVMDEAFLPAQFLPTGINPLDELLDGGLRGGEVMVLAARPRVGKSALALQIVMHVAVEGLSVGLWSLEMRDRAWIRRAIAGLATVNNRMLRRGGLTDLEGERLRNVVQSFRRIPIWFAIGASDPETFRLEATEMVNEGAALLVIDYLQQMQPPAGAYNRENEVATISRIVKQTALELDVPFILLAQLNREAEEKRPNLANLRESGSIEQDADIVLFLHRERDKETGILQNLTWAIVDKNRDGESGSFRLDFDGPHMRFLT